MVIKVRFDSLDDKAHDVELAFDPQLTNDGSDDVGWTRGHALLAHDRRMASALLARPALTRTSSGYKGHDDALLEHSYDALRPGNVVQQAHTRLTGRADHQDLTLAISFAQVASQALAVATASLDAGFDAYKQGWVDYRATLFPIPATALPLASTYETSLLVLKAHEDKDHPGAFVASPSMPWGWGELKIDTDNPRSAPYHLVWARDLYQIATAMLAAGDKAGANRALTSCSPISSSRTGRSRRTRRSTGSPSGRASRWTSRACRSCSPASSAAPPRRLDARPEGRGGYPRQGPEHRPGALGEPGRVLAGDDRGRDRGAGLRGRHRAQERRDGQERRDLREDRGRVGGQGPGLDGDDERPVLAGAVLPAPDQGPQARQGHEVRHRRLRHRRSTSARSSTPPSSSSSGSASSAPTIR